MPHDDIVRRLRIRGRVQGVGYRWAMVEQARALGLRGWVRNRRDGSVEAVVAGPAPEVERIVGWARRGPPAAAVAAVDVVDDESRFGLDAGFVQRSTE
jgi:acylphosphatase